VVWWLILSQELLALQALTSIHQRASDWPREKNRTPAVTTAADVSCISCTKGVWRTGSRSIEPEIGPSPH
jgi:hypothetical protein